MRQAVLCGVNCFTAKLKYSGQQFCQNLKEEKKGFNIQQNNDPQ